MSTVVEKASENKEAIKYVALFLVFCVAFYLVYYFSACVLAYPTTFRNKGVGIAFGVPSLYAINIFRLIVLTLVGISYPGMFEFVHMYLWQASFIIFVVVIFLLWLHFLSARKISPYRACG